MFEEYSIEKQEPIKYDLTELEEVCEIFQENKDCEAYIYLEIRGDPWLDQEKR
jgi:hypothetical protein